MEVEPLDVVIEGLVWVYGPGGNVDHIAQHFVRPADVQFVLDHDPIFTLNAPGHTATHIMLGRDDHGRAIFVAILETEIPGLWTVITALEHRNTRRYLEEQGR